LRHPPVWGNDIDWIVGFDDHPTAVIRCRDVRGVTPIGGAFPEAGLCCIRDPDFDDSGRTRDRRIRVCSVGPYEQFIAVGIQGYILVAQDMRQLPLELHVSVIQFEAVETVRTCRVIAYDDIVFRCNVQAIESACTRIENCALCIRRDLI